LCAVLNDPSHRNLHTNVGGGCTPRLCAVLDDPSHRNLHTNVGGGVGVNRPGMVGGS
jgi:hypothetical protein